VTHDGIPRRLRVLGIDFDGSWSAYETIFDRLGLSKDAIYCDVGCGSGMAASIASKRGARVFGLDAAENLLVLARALVPSGDFRCGDMEELPFADGVFDLVTGFNSFQYAGNPCAALTEARRITKPGGQVVVMTWGTPEGMQAASLVTALRGLLPAPLPGAPGPFALSDESGLRRFALEAGLTPLRVEDVECEWLYTNLDSALRGLGSSGVAARAIENSGEEAVSQAHTTALEPFREKDGGYRIGASFRWLAALA
jgi:SAM-dependent methyltransferase